MANDKSPLLQMNPRWAGLTHDPRWVDGYESSYLLQRGQGVLSSGFLYSRCQQELWVGCSYFTTSSGVWGLSTFSGQVQRPLVTSIRSAVVACLLGLVSPCFYPTKFLHATICTIAIFCVDSTNEDFNAGPYPFIKLHSE
jgi:hypothetical protein